jgi:hypothetical protein
VRTVLRLGNAYLEYDVAWQLEQHITDEVQRQSGQVLISSHTKIFGETFDARVGN